MNRSQGILRYENAIPGYTQNSIFGLACPTQEVRKSGKDLGSDLVDRRNAVLSTGSDLFAISQPAAIGIKPPVSQPPGAYV